MFKYVRGHVTCRLEMKNTYKFHMHFKMSFKEVRWKLWQGSLADGRDDRRVDLEVTVSLQVL
jgi:hypothetical protein